MSLTFLTKGSIGDHSLAPVKQTFKGSGLKYAKEFEKAWEQIFR